MHVHLAEQRDDVAASASEHGATPLRALQGMGVVDELLVAVHACHLDGEELAALGAARGSIAYNPSSNMALGDGVTDLPAALEARVRIALGTDGGCANNQYDVFREMRAAEHLQRVTRRRMGVLTASGGMAQLFAMGTVEGYRALGLSGGSIEVGAFADLVALDPDDSSLQPLALTGDAVADLELVLAQAAFAMSPRAAITDVLVGGRAIVRERTTVQVEVAEVAARVRVLPQAR